MMEKTPLQQLIESNEQVRKTRKKSARAQKTLGRDVERFYRVQLRSLVRLIAREVEAEIAPVLKQEKPSYQADSVYTMDETWAERIIGVLRGLSERFTGTMFTSQYERLARRTVSMAEAESSQAFLKSVNEAVGIDMAPIMDQSGMRDYIEAASYQNAQLIKTVPQEFLTRVENAVVGGVRDGDSPAVISRRIREATGVTRRQADRIARDQTAKLTSEITERRQVSAGIKHYRSVDAGDERVTGRPGGKYPDAKISCWGIARRDIGFGPGVYSWKQGASWGGQTGLHPGRHHINCRCTSSPVFEWELPDK